MTETTHAYAVPGDEAIIDMENPETGRTVIYGETLAEVRQRYPRAERVLFSEWIAAKAERQHVPVQWRPVTSERYHEMLNVLPPIGYDSRGFLVGEPMDHDVSTGAPRYTAFRHLGLRYWESSRPLTVREFRQVV